MKMLQVKTHDDAVSPVVGVMLMLVVTIIIAAVVSGFAGSLIGSTDKAPSLAMDVRVVNTGSYIGSGLFATVTGASEPIPTKDVVLTTSWRSASGAFGGATVVPGEINSWGAATRSADNLFVGIAPWGIGSGIMPNGSDFRSNALSPWRLYGTAQSGQNAPANQFGNYVLMPGTTMFVRPGPYTDNQAIAGQLTADAPGFDGGYGMETLFKYVADSLQHPEPLHLDGPPTSEDYANAAKSTQGTITASGSYDGMQAVLGYNWYELRLGDPVTITIAHTPSGKTIFQKTVTVTEA